MNQIKNTAFILLAVCLIPTGCKKGGEGGSMIQKGSTVTMHYTLTVEGQTVDTSVGKEPLSYVQGSGQIIPGLEEQMQGLQKGNKKEVTVSPEKGYGNTDLSAMKKVPKTAFKDGAGMKVGSVVGGQVQGQPFQAVIAEMDKDTVTLDFNHPLAGKTLKFSIEVMDVKAGA